MPDNMPGDDTDHDAAALDIIAETLHVRLSQEYARRFAVSIVDALDDKHYEIVYTGPVDEIEGLIGPAS